MAHKIAEREGHSQKRVVTTMKNLLDKMWWQCYNIDIKNKGGISMNHSINVFYLVEYLTGKGRKVRPIPAHNSQEAADFVRSALKATDVISVSLMMNDWF